MKHLALILAALTLVGCAHWEPVKPEEKIVVKQEYIIRIPPAESLTIPAKVPDIPNLDSATQGDVAKWLAEYEDRTKKLEAKLIEIGKFFKDEQTKLENK
jgi:hypothetical protein